MSSIVESLVSTGFFLSSRRLRGVRAVGLSPSQDLGQLGRAPVLRPLVSALRGGTLTDAKTVVITELLSADILKRDVPDAAERLAYISGPHVMVEHARSLLREQGARTSRIKTDFFSGY